jgi:hypothetical protein
MWQPRAESRCGCGRGEPSPGADVAGATFAACASVQRMEALRCVAGRPDDGWMEVRCGTVLCSIRPELQRSHRKGYRRRRPSLQPSRGADVAAVSPVPAQMRQGSHHGRTTGRVSAAIPRSCALRSHPARSPQRSSAGDNISMQQRNDATMQRARLRTADAHARCVHACVRSGWGGRLQGFHGVASMCSMPPTKRSRAFPAPRPRACTPRPPARSPCVSGRCGTCVRQPSRGADVGGVSPGPQPSLDCTRPATAAK